MSRYAPGISSPFGPRDIGFHHGQDYFWLSADTAGSRRILAVARGTVTRIEMGMTFNREMGNCVWVDHGGILARYTHMGVPVVKVGQKVTPDTYLGPMSNTGTAARGEIHLHFEVWVNGKRVDPESYFVKGLRPGSLLTLAQARELAAWLKQPYDSKQYWLDVQQRGIWGRFYNGAHDGIPGAKTFAAERELWQRELGPKPHERTTVSPQGVYRRAQPTTKGAPLGLVKGGVKIDMDGYVRAVGNHDPHIEVVNGSGVWFTDAGEYFHSSGFTDTTTSGLNDLTDERFPAKEPEPASPVEPEPIPEPEPEEPIEEPIEEPEEPTPTDPAPEPEPVEPESNRNLLRSLIILVGSALVGGVIWLIDRLTGVFTG